MGEASSSEEVLIGKERFFGFVLLDHQVHMIHIKSERRPQCPLDSFSQHEEKLAIRFEFVRLGFFFFVFVNFLHLWLFFVRVVYDVCFLMLTLVAGKVKSLLRINLSLIIGFFSQYCADHFSIV